MAVPSFAFRPMPTELLRARARDIQSELARRNMSVEQQQSSASATEQQRLLALQRRQVKQLLANRSITPADLVRESQRRQAAAVAAGRDPRTAEATAILQGRAEMARAQNARVQQEYASRVQSIKRECAITQAQYDRTMQRDKAIIQQQQAKLIDLRNHVNMLEASKERAKTIEARARVEQTLDNLRNEYRNQLASRTQLLKKVQDDRRGFIQDIQKAQMDLRQEQAELARQKSQLELMRKGAAPTQSLEFRVTPTPNVARLWDDFTKRLSFAGDAEEIGIQEDVSGFQIGAIEDGGFESLDLAGGINALNGNALASDDTEADFGSEQLEDLDDGDGTHDDLDEDVIL